ncbi:hypothetical protein SAMN05192588_0292 [Nonlabens sp. Hel1_33_55]|uniref:hypothetical protein n=1 Tax=Nonlabens sp. Hel1_33_55 TaxID=1336802 RepID=UPI000875BCED|nr:hypothetical protein [Nonlabens sp. Hel1_33_55]SCX92614.1 hypothetical protein SAMN05192588_0292 [Nonlabens sp. Hel1_33_55]
MKSFLKYLFLTISIIIVANFILGAIVDYSLRSISGSTLEERDKIVEGEISSDVILLGISRGKISWNLFVF